MTSEREDGTAGFTLVEVLVAFAILSLTLIALFEGLGVGVRGLAGTEVRAEALALARSKLAGLGLVEAVEPGITRGPFEGGYGWELEVEPVPVGEDAVWSMVRPYRARLTVLRSPGDRPLVTLETVVLAASADVGAR